jgi:hypothetical protein
VSAGDHSVPNTGTYYWSPVPGDSLSEQCKLRITALNNANATNTSEGYFYIRGRLTVTIPAGGEGWQVGTSHLINWTKQGNIATVDISYSWNNGTNWTTLTSGETASNLSWNWSIDLNETTSAQARIKVADSSIPDIVYNLSEIFSVKGSLNLTAPSDTGIVMTYDGSNTYNISATSHL